VIRVVLDTNILVSALLSRLGKEALVVEAVRSGTLRPCLSAEILEEYAGVLFRSKFSFEPAVVNALLVLLRDRGALSNPRPSTYRSPDPSDNKFLHCAAEAKARFLVTGNQRHFPQRAYGTTSVVNAGELLDHVARRL